MTPRGQAPRGAGDTPEATQASFVDPAASMSLLTSLLANPLDAGYVHYRAEHGPTPNRFIGRLGVFVVAVALGFGSIVATASLRTPAGDVKADLKHQAAQRSEQVASLDEEIQSLGRAIDLYSRSDTVTDTDHALALASATVPVSGPGITVTLTDRATPGKGSGAVRDQDLAMVVNALWGAGAEAISINGQRIGPATFVRTAGTVILVNITPVSSPYVVSAIGDSNALSVALVRGNTGDYLSAAQSMTGMTVSTKVAPSLSMDALAPTSSQYATAITATNDRNRPGGPARPDRSRVAGPLPTRRRRRRARRALWCRARLARRQVRRPCLRDLFLLERGRRLPARLPRLAAGRGLGHDDRRRRGPGNPHLLQHRIHPSTAAEGLT